MNKALVIWLSVMLATVVSFTSFAEEATDKRTDKFIGKWDTRAGIISFSIKEVNGEKRVRMLVVDENAEGKLPLDMSAADLDEFEDMIGMTIEEMGDTATAPVPPLGTKEVTKRMGRLVFPNGKLTLAVVHPAGTKRYASMIVMEKDRRYQYVFWMEKSDLETLKSLIDRAMKVLGV